MNTIEYLIKRLEEIGVTDFFGVPDNYNLNIVSAVDSDPDANWIGCTNALNAGYASDGYARQKGFGAFVTSYGAGELSALNAVAGSYAENVPVVNIVGTPSAETIKKINPNGYIESYKNIVSAYAFLNKDNAKIEIDRILKILIKERKPVYVAIPEDVALIGISNKKADYDWISNPDTLETAVKLIVKKINQSKSPVIVADALIKRFNCRSEFCDFVKTSGIPVTNFLPGANAICMDYENYLGTYLCEYEYSSAKDRLDNSDCPIFVGLISAEVSPFNKPLPYNADSHIAIYGSYTCIEGQKYEEIKMSDVLREVAKNISYKDVKIVKPEIGYGQSVLSKDKLSSDYIYPRLQEFFKGEDIIFTDKGVITFGTAKIKLPENCEMHCQLMWNSSGWAAPASFGASIANPKARVILVAGDGAYQISAMETGSMCRYGVKPVVIIINNSGYTTERFISSDFDNKYNDTIGIDYSKFARSFAGDIWSTRVETADDFDKALRVTQIMGKLCVIEAVTDKSDMPEIAEKFYTGKRHTEIQKNNIGKKNKISGMLKFSTVKKYETNVHKSLQGYDKE